MENRWADHFSHWPIVWPPPAVSRFSRSRRHGRREKTTLNFPMNIPNGNQSSSTPIARTRRSPSFSFVFLSLLSSLPSIYLTRRSSVARGTLTLMISSISGTSPLLVPFSWLSSAILRGSSFAMKERRHFCLAAFRDDSRVCRRQRRLPPFLDSWGTGQNRETRRTQWELAEYWRSARCTTFTPLAPPAAWRHKQKYRAKFKKQFNTQSQLTNAKIL